MPGAGSVDGRDYAVALRGGGDVERGLGEGDAGLGRQCRGAFWPGAIRPTSLRRKLIPENSLVTLLKVSSAARASSRLMSVAETRTSPPPSMPLSASTMRPSTSSRCWCELWVAVPSTQPLGEFSPQQIDAVRRFDERLRKLLGEDVAYTLEPKLDGASIATRQSSCSM